MRTSRRSVLVPKLVTSLETYDRVQFSRDPLAGVVVGIVGSPILAEIGQDNLFGNLDDALNRARRELVPSEPAPPAATPTVRRETRGSEVP